MSTILVTGGMGLVGLYTSRELVRRGDKVVILDPECRYSVMEQEGKSWGSARVGDSTIYDAFPAATRFVLGPYFKQITFVHGDVLNMSELVSLIQRYKVEKIIHAASFFDPLLEFENPWEAFKINVEGSVAAFEAARISKIGRVVYLSSIAAYGIRESEPIHETHPVYSIVTGNPSGPHGSVKAASEVLGMTYHSAYEVDFVGLRLAAAFGVGMRLPLHIRPMVEAAVDGKTCTFDQGEMRREYMHVADTARCVVKALDADPKRLKQRVFNVGLGRIVSTQELADTVREVIPGTKIIVGGGMSELEASNIRMRGRLDVSAAREQLGFEAQMNLKAGIAAFAEDLRRFRRGEQYDR